MTSFCSSFPEVSLPSNRSNHYFAFVLPHLSELMSKIGMQLAIRRTDQSKPFPVIVLLQCARLFYALHCAILGCFVQIRTASRRASCRVSSRKIQAFARQAASWSSVPVKPYDMDLNPPRKSCAERYEAKG